MMAPATAVTLTMPEASLTAETVAPATAPFERIAVEPLAGAVKITLMPGTGLPAASLTMATRGAPKEVEMVLSCGSASVPPFT
jgi:hypothetical protein